MSVSSVTLTHPTGRVQCTIPLPSSKSESNRLLIIRALSGTDTPLHNLAAARDTQTMMRLLQSDEEEVDVLDAGTTMRFLTAYYALSGQTKVMTGTPRMCERPIGPLVDALRQIGAQITYLNHEGYPPMRLEGFHYEGHHRVTLPGNISSQYISALLMVAPTLPDGLEIELTGPIGSRPYIEMTRALMRDFGVDSEWHGNLLSVGPQPYLAQEYTVESDWSGASYWYAIAALATDAEIVLKGLKKDSLQGDSRLVELMRPLGVQTEFIDGGLRLTHTPAAKETTINFVDCPDVAQTIFVVCAAKGIQLQATGLESLRVKETDRILALQQELGKFGHRIEETHPGHWTLRLAQPMPTHELTTIHTYDDHRMAMAFAPLALRQPLRIEDPDVVNKSYPSFWQDLETADFDIIREAAP
ncbi:3-phosphoshikimate 1-carboxyvinyltransferase [Catalinimonas alkaloidigena]|uniref:3-phosphoshikimate 1-carboxyvinyltransferase n=1 Tax=Catalinimonas alkaloidigena TaxID=1075417 RepID=A0A1G9ABK8_9BACT|nr:3-phosphoshikimate 1-carboxyvinyltransferase [Catalinimonas alkaloidigena]SDK24631.1 3-phosphoshikimate 1-carboxyvinyltransferase [Catalinimonas alkaloidigena]